MQNLIFSIFPNQNFVDLGLFQFGWERCTPAHSFGPAARNHYLFHYILSGTGTLMADDSKGVTQTYSIKSMQGFMIFPNQITTYEIGRALDTIGLSLDKPVYHARNKSLREDMANEMLYISRHKDESPFHLIGHLYLFLDYLLRSAADEQLEHGSKLREFYIHEALTYIEHNFQNEITIEDIAGVCGLNRTYFGKIFKEALGKTPQEFLLNYRMLKAAELLKLTSLSIGDVGLAVGYANQMHFSRAFKNNYGISPREWRYQNHINNTVDSDEEHTQ